MTDFSITASTPEDAPTVRAIGICGGLTIHHADEIRIAMMEALSEAAEVRLDLEKVTEIDLVGLQLICSAHRSAITERKHFTVTKGDAAVVSGAADAGGFTRHVGCIHDIDHTCIWSGGGN